MSNDRLTPEQQLILQEIMEVLDIWLGLGRANDQVRLHVRGMIQTIIKKYI